MFLFFSGIWVSGYSDSWAIRACIHPHPNIAGIHPPALTYCYGIATAMPWHCQVKVGCPHRSVDCCFLRPSFAAIQCLSAPRGGGGACIAWSMILWSPKGGGGSRKLWYWCAAVFHYFKLILHGFVDFLSFGVLPKGCVCVALPAALWNPQKKHAPTILEHVPYGFY